MNYWLGKYPGRTLHRIGAALSGFWLAAMAINILWPLPDQIYFYPSYEDQEFKKFPILKKAISILIIISDVHVNNNEKAKEKNADTLISLLKVSPKKPIRFVHIDKESKVILKGQKYKYRMDEIYKKGGVALISEIIQKHMMLSKEVPERFLVLSSNSKNALLKDLGLNLVQTSYSKLKVSSKGELSYNDDTQIINLLNVENSNVELYKSTVSSGRIINLKEDVTMLGITNLASKYLKSENTNISLNEFHALLTAISNNNMPVIFKLKLGQ